MKLEEIKAAVLAGRTVHWKNGAYRVVHDSVGQWLIKCEFNGHCWGLTWANGVTMNGEESDFFLAPLRVTATFRKPCGGVVTDDSYHEPVADAREAAAEDAHRYGWELVGVEVGHN